MASVSFQIGTHDLPLHNYIIARYFIRLMAESNDLAY